MKMGEFAKLAGVSKMAISKAQKSGQVVRNKKGEFSPSNRLNKKYVGANKGNRRRQKVAAHVAKIEKAQAKKSKETSNKKSIGNSKTIDNEVGDEPISKHEESEKQTKNSIEKRKLLAEARIKEIHLSETMKEIIPFSFAREKLARFGTILQNSLLVLPERLADEIIMLVIEKGKDARPDIVGVWSKALALAVNESKRGIRQANEE